MTRAFLLLAAVAAVAPNAWPQGVVPAYDPTPVPLPPGLQALAAAPDEYVPMTNREKFGWTMGCIVQPEWILYSGLIAGLGQVQNSPPQWRQGAKGYARRFAAAHALEAFDDTVWFAGSALHHEDPRYLRSGRTGFGPRLADALAVGLQSRRDNGTNGFAYARTVAGLGTDLFARAIYPDRKAFTARNMLLSALEYAVVREALSVAREFLPDILKGHTSTVMDAGIPESPPPRVSAPSPQP